MTISQESVGLSMIYCENPGFGNGRLISEMIPKVIEGKVCGIDISEEMVKLASEQNSQ